MKRKSLLVFFFSFFLLLCLSACSLNPYSSAIPEPSPEFHLDGYITLGIHIPKNNKTAYLTVVAEENYDPEISLSQLPVQIFVLTREKGTYSNPVPFDLPEGLNYNFGMTVSPDGKKMYLSAQSEDFFGNDSPSLLSGDIIGSHLENPTPLTELNTSNAQFIAGCDSRNNLIYISNVSDCYAQLFYSSYNGSQYEKGILMPETVNLGSNQSAGAALSPDGLLLINSQFIYHDTNYPVLLLASEKESDSWTSLRPFDLSINNLTDSHLLPSISGDGKNLYFVSLPIASGNISDTTSQNTVYKVNLKAALKTLIDDSHLSAPSEYNQVKFPLKLRNKGDESQKQGIYYEVFVRAFADSDGDGIGDFNGLTAKLDYLKDLGIDGLWLMPVNESPSYHGYDVTDYYSLNSDYGTEEDFINLINEAHKRNIKIIMDFVINHTSSLHPWFTSAAFSPSSPYRDYYRFVSPSDTRNYSSNDFSSWGSAVWHPAGSLFYYGIFSEYMPDLNYNNKSVRDEIKKAAKKWLELGVDGFRLDAAIHIYGDNEFKEQDQESSNIQWWNEFALACEAVNPDVYLVGEAWKDDNPLTDYVQPFDTKFDFTLQSDMLYAVKNGISVTSHGDDLAQSIEKLLLQYIQTDSKYIDGLFASNHDQERVMSTLRSSQKAKLLADIYLTLSGNPFIYYGEELGMFGNKPDELIRLDFKWSDAPDELPNTHWYEVYDEQDFSSLNADTPSLESQMNDPDSMYNHYKEIIHLRKSHSALSSGTYEALSTNHSNILGYRRSFDNESLLVFHNLCSKDVVIELNELKPASILYASRKGAALSGQKLTIPALSTVIAN